MKYKHLFPTEVYKVGGGGRIHHTLLRLFMHKRRKNAYSLRVITPVRKAL